MKTEKPKFRLHLPVMRVFNSNLVYYKGYAWEGVNPTGILYVGLADIYLTVFRKR